MRKPTGSPRPERPSKSRWVVLACGLALVWTAYGYCLGGPRGLLVLAAVATTLAVALPGALPGTTRTVIWSYLLAVLLCLTANLSRLGTPADGPPNLFDHTPYDRTATLFFAAGVAVLFFRPSRGSVTILAGSLLPPLMMALETAKEAGRERDLAILPGVALAWVVLAAQLQQMAGERTPDGPRPGRREWAWRLLLPTVWLALAAWGASPVATVAEATREWLYRQAGLEPPGGDRSRRNASVLSVASPPNNLAGQVRVVMMIDADRCPGYLREAVFRSYGSRQWSGRSTLFRDPELRPEQAGAADRESGVTYALEGAAAEGVDSREWTFLPWRKGYLSSLCLPGTARTLSLPDGLDPTVNSDGIVQVGQGAPPLRYKARVDPADGNTAYPRPTDPADLRDYLEVPVRLAPAVSNWVQRCGALADTRRTDAAIEAVVGYFRTQFTYRLGIPLGHLEPLEAFMESREGHCTLFASAAALMLRSRGIPVRVVAGFLCSERHASTGRWTVRERDAHAWCEAWNADTGQWQLVEATPPGALPAGWPELGSLRLSWERMVDAWKRLVELLRTSNPVLVLAEWLAGAWAWSWDAVRSPVGIVLLGLSSLAGLTRWGFRRRCRRKDADDDLRLRAELIRKMDGLERRWVPPHLRRRASEPWADWQARMEAELPEEQATRLRGVLERYQELRYSPSLDRDRARAWLAESNGSKPNRKRGLRYRIAGVSRRNFRTATQGAGH